jgi:hypothetical protein
VKWSTIAPLATNAFGCLLDRMKIDFRLLAVALVFGSFVGGRVLAADPVSFSVGEFTFDRPEGWGWVSSTSTMRKAQLKVEGVDGGLGEVVFFHFGPGQGGSVDANVQRWLAQFQGGEPGASRREVVGDRGVTFVEAAGTFLSGMPGTPAVPMDGFALRGAILESREGDVYAKFTGPAELVEANSPAFEDMVRSALNP